MTQMTFYNLNGVSIHLEKFVSARVKPKGSEFYILVTIRSTKSTDKVKKIKSPLYPYKLDANIDMSEMIEKINKLETK
jgi:hypothetical protein